MFLGMLTLLACTRPDKGPEESGDAPGETADPDSGDTGEGPGADVIAEAYGGCRQEGIETDGELGEIATREHEYDENGDVTRMVADYHDDETFYDYEIVFTWGEPHELATSDVTYTRDDVEGWRSRYTWEDGAKVHEERDYGPDGDLDEAGDYTYEDHFLSRWAWDSDGDGVVDDVADFTWTPTEDGWLEDSTGTDANGPYTGTWTLDTAFNMLTYDYADATGLTVQATGSGYNALFEATDYWEGWSQDGELFWDEHIHLEFDELGRPIEETREIAEYRRGRETGSLWRQILYSYDCP